MTTSWRRHHNATGTGELDGPDGSEPKARATYAAYWFDGIGRQVARADYGTAGGTAPTRPASPPERSDNTLVTTTAYNERGETYSSTDTAGIETRWEYDNRGRQVLSVGNYQPEAEGSDANVTVATTYTADGKVLTLTVSNPTTGDQVTRYVYGTTFTDSGVARADLLRAETAPDSDDTTDPLGNGADGLYDRNEYCYNRLGQVTQWRNRNGTIHVYEYDGLGRLVQDRVPTLGYGIAGQVRRIGASFNVRGQVDTVTSYDNPTVGAGSTVNEVKFQYNDFGLLAADFQEHAGTVNISASPQVAYAYADGSDNHVRRTSIAYPNGRVLRYEYSTGDDDVLGRLSFLADDSSGNVGTHLAEYTYLGLSAAARVAYPQPNLRYDLAHGSGSDPYAGLDRFDRVVDLRWRDLGNSLDAERIQHAYDRAGNRLWRQNTLAPAGHDELYAYDNLDRVVDFNRGDLNGEKTTITDLVLRQHWHLDETGNWSRFEHIDQGNNANSLDQTREHNAANELTGFACSVGDLWATPQHDRAGNATTIPQPLSPTDTFLCTYDAWNRLVRVVDGDENGVEYVYDGVHRRILRKAYAESQPVDARHVYYSDAWQVLEERVDTATVAERQFVWGLRFVDDLVLRDRDATQSGTLGERLYAIQDANWNVTAIAGVTGTVVERNRYHPFGTCQVLDGSFATRTASSYGWEHLFTGRELDPATGLYDHRSRALHPLTGRFLTRDPLDLGAGPNLYAASFVPHGTDPFGESYINDGSWQTPEERERRRAQGNRRSGSDRVATVNPYGDEAGQTSPSPADPPTQSDPTQDSSIDNRSAGTPCNSSSGKAGGGKSGGGGGGGSGASGGGSGGGLQTPSLDRPGYYPEIATPTPSGTPRRPGEYPPMRQSSPPLGGDPAPNAPDDSDRKEAGPRQPPAGWPDPKRGWKWDPSQGKYKKGGRYRKWHEDPHHKGHWDDSDKNGRDHKNIYEYTRVVGWGAIIVGLGWGAWELGKWGAAAFFVPETGGGSLLGAAALP
jgi:RHS repeat-associated protein